MAEAPEVIPTGTSSTTVSVSGRLEPTLTDKVQMLGALGMVVVALLVIAYLAVFDNEQAQGALIGVVSAGVGFYLRGKVIGPNS